MNGGRPFTKVFFLLAVGPAAPFFKGYFCGKVNGGHPFIKAMFNFAAGPGRLIIKMYSFLIVNGGRSSYKVDLQPSYWQLSGRSYSKGLSLCFVMSGRSIFKGCILKDIRPAAPSYVDIFL